MTRLESIVAAIRAPDPACVARVQARLDAKTKPRGSLGRLEELACWLAAVRRRDDPSAPRAAVVVMAGDHGVVAEGVSAYPSEVTAQMLANFAAGGAAINVLARLAGAEVLVVDVGSRAPAPIPGVLDRRVARGTANLRREPAMTVAQATAAIEVGLDVVEHLAARGVDGVALGDMGIGNTTAASCLAAAYTDTPAERVTGRGCGLDGPGQARKARVVAEACARHLADGPDALAILARLGGLELAGLAGVVLGAAARGWPVVVDGFPTTAAAVAAARLAPAAALYCVAAHRSVEPGHEALLAALDARPLLDLGLRLGEGTGAALALPLLTAATRILADMATFEGAGVTDSGR
jgi:nicotinate-nucleotide--dimethylbenzimidazole phosphoribosyltransferase